MEGHTYTQCSVEVNLAESVWDLVSGLEAMENPPRAIAVCLDVDDDANVNVTYYNYEGEATEKEHDNIVAVMAVSAGADDSVDLDEFDPEMVKAMQFMYFYQAIHTVIDRFEREVDLES